LALKDNRYRDVMKRPLGQATRQGYAALNWLIPLARPPHHSYQRSGGPPPIYNSLELIVLGVIAIRMSNPDFIVTRTDVFLVLTALGARLASVLLKMVR